MPPFRAFFCLALALTACAAAPPPMTPRPAPAGAGPAKPERLAECLARKGAHLYGASWCHWCHVQLEKFGPDAPKIPYTDCDPEGKLEFLPACEKAGVPFGTTVPVWLFSDGSRLYGVRAPAVIAAVSGCSAP